MTLVRGNRIFLEFDFYLYTIKVYLVILSHFSKPYKFTRMLMKYIIPKHKVKPVKG